VRGGLRGLALADVNAAVRRHLRWEGVKVVMVGEGMAGLRKNILANVESPMTYNSPKPGDILREDEVVMRRLIPLSPEDAVVAGVDQMFA
jgi:zinc protease